MDGLSLIREMVRRGAPPAIAVTAQQDLGDVVAGLEAGADDFVTKPVELKELSARVRAVLRRAGGSAIEEIGPFVIHSRLARVSKSGELLALGPVEHRLLVELVSEPRRLRTREDSSRSSRVRGGRRTR